MPVDEAKEKPDYYKILNVDRDAKPDAIRQAYYTAVAEWSPDDNPIPYSQRDTPEYKDEQIRREQGYKAINEAYAVLGNIEKRSSYDLKTEEERKRVQEEEKTPKIEDPLAVPSVKVTVNDSPVSSVEKKDAALGEHHHEVTRSGKTFTYETKLENNQLALQNTHCPSASPFPNEAIIAYLQDQIMQAQRVFGSQKITIDIPENMDENLKKAYVMVCHANNVECSVNTVKQENKNEDKSLQKLRETVLEDMEQRLNDLHKNLKESKVPNDFSSQIAEIKRTIEIQKTKFSSTKDFKKELKAEALLSLTGRLETLARVTEMRAEKEKEIKATLAQETKISAGRPSRRM